MYGIENQTGFKITGSQLQKVELLVQNNFAVIDQIDEAYFSETLDFTLGKETKISALLQGAFNELQVRNPIQSAVVSFSLPYNLFLSALLPYDNSLLSQDIMWELRWELSILFPTYQIDDFVIQYFEIPKNKYLNSNLLFVAAIPRKFLHILHNFCSRNKLKLKFVDYSHLASDRALGLNYANFSSGLTLSVYYGNRVLSLIFYLDGKPFYFKIKKEIDASEIVKNILKEIEPSVMLNSHPLDFESAFISGDDITEAACKAISQKININLTYFNPFQKLQTSPFLSENNLFKEKFNSFSPAVGIALRLA